jgi:hypothetical protein
MKKYKLTENALLVKAVPLYQIQALKDFGDIKAGDLGGWIQSEANLSQKGLCWVDNHAVVCEDAHVRDNAQVYDHAQVYNCASISGDAIVYGRAMVYEQAQVYDKAHVYDHAKIYGMARVYGRALIFNAARIYGNAEIYVEVNFDCDFNPWTSLCNLVESKDAPLLMGIDPNFDKVLSQFMKKKGA